MKTIKAQRLASTYPDSNSDRRDKKFLEEWIAGMPPRFPIGQHHDDALPTIGYIENFRLEEDSTHPGEWFVVGDAYVEDDFDWSKHGGFSYAIAEIAKERPDEIGVLYVPYPFYRDDKVIEEILSYDLQLSAGRWIKKGANLEVITLIVTSIPVILWPFEPARDKLYHEVVWPFLDKVLKKYREGRFKDLAFDYGAMAVGNNGEKIQLLFIPDRKNCERSFTKELIRDGLEKAKKCIVGDKKGAAVGIKQIKLYFHDQQEGYRIDSIQYSDGTVTQLLNVQS